MRSLLFFGVIASFSLFSCAVDDFHPYTGQQQNWPTSPGAITDAKYAIPVYYGFPPLPYRVLGSLDATTASGMNAVGYAASKAKALGADAVLFQTKGTQIVGATGFGNATATQIGGTSFASGTATSVPITWNKASVIAIKWL